MTTKEKRTDPIRIGIAGYGNLGKGVETAIASVADMKLSAVFTRRDPAAIRLKTPNVPVLPLDRAASWKNGIDVLILCAGSAVDLPEMTPALAEYFNVVDSYDHHARIDDHFNNVNAAAEKSGTLALVSAGWDPGLFSLIRLYNGAIFPNGNDYTFWGKGVSQGHSDAIRRVPGVADARQYTVPVESALERVRNGDNPQLSTREKHVRHCYVAAEDGADRGRIEREIKTMPGYFADYDTTVHFVTIETLRRDHPGLPHGGTVFRTGTTGTDAPNPYLIEYHVKMASNPEFTGAVLVAYARAVYRKARRGETGCRTVLDIAPAELSPLPGDTLRRALI